ncbi:MAG: LynF/TruF/PatF family peptide O-prenyltransferase [Microcystis aeruginosa G13-09]|nr:LynF/TruF/PatF family peptide O-prenyltransferase [Microcystis aeruginosa G13-09]
MIVAEIQKNSLKEQRIQFIRNHQQAFDVEPIYPLRLFEDEDFVMEVEGDCNIEASCKIELDKLIASRFMLFFKDQSHYSLLQKFLGHNFDFSKLEVLSAGLDLRTNLADSSLKIHIRIKDYPEKLQTAFVLSNGAADSDYLSEFVELIGFDFYFNGKSEIEIYTELQEDDFFRPETINLVWRHFPDSVLKPLQGSNLFFTGLSKANNNAVLYYHLNNRQDLTNYFKINDTAQRVHSFYQHQDILPSMWVGTTQKELEKTRIENIRLYYYKFFKME